MSETLKEQPVPVSLFPTQVIDLPSKGKLYSEDNPLSKGTIELRYMTAREEDILTTESYIKQGIVLDKLFQSLIVDKTINYDTLLLGDRNAILIAARLYGYGEKYAFKVTNPSGKQQPVEIDLNDIKPKEMDDSVLSSGQNLFTFTTPFTGNVIEFKLLTVSDEREIDERLKKYKKPGAKDAKLTTRLFQMITSIDGHKEPQYIKSFIENSLRALDSKALRTYIKTVQPDVDMTIELVDDETEEPFQSTVNIGLDFFWPDI